MRFPVITILLFCYLPILFASEHWTLDACIERAKTESIALKQKRVAVDQAYIGVKEAESQHLPVASASLGQSYNMGMSPTASGASAKFNSSVNTFSASVTQPIFNGLSVRNGIKAQRLELKAVAAELDQSMQNIAIDVAAAYLQVLLNKEMVKTAQEQLSLSKKQIGRTQELVRAGKVPASEVIEGKAQIAKDSAALISSANDLKISLIDLSVLLNIPVLSENEVEQYEQSLPPDAASQSIDSVFRQAVIYHPFFQGTKYRMEKGEFDIRTTRGGYWPSVDLKAGYSNGYYFYYNLSQGTNNDSFSSQFRQNRQEVVSLNVQIPIFNRFDVQRKVQTARLNIRQQELAADNENLQLQKTIQQVCNRATASKAKQEAYKQAIEASQAAYNYSLEKFAVGKATAFEVNQKQTELLKARSQEIEARYDYLFANKTIELYTNPATK
jgi:outer membrane protein